MEFLASDALRGRGSGTPDERLAATYIASELRRAGVAPAGSAPANAEADLSAYFQPVTVHTRTSTSPPRLTIHSDGRTLELTAGKDFYLPRLPDAEMQGALQHGGVGNSIGNKAFVLSSTQAELSSEQVRSQLDSMRGKAAALLVTLPKRFEKRLESKAAQLPASVPEFEGSGPAEDRPQVIYLQPAALQQLRSFPDGAGITLHAETAEETYHTENVIGILHGQDASLSGQAILLSAHLDHLGVGTPVKGDDIYNGADDDASGVSAVLELARALARPPGPRRTVIFAFFGSEEKGLWGSTYYREHPTIPLDSIVANLEFEMIARPDAAISPDALWLSGWDRTNLGPELAGHGARLVSDPHPEQDFFRRSDNYAFAGRGVVAQTVSSYGLHPDYHRPSDDLSKVDWDHLIGSIASMIQPVRWLANSDFKPEWKEGKKPSRLGEQARRRPNVAADILPPGVYGI